MDAAFLLIVRKHPGPGALGRVPPSEQSTDLGFEARHRLEWSDLSGAVGLVCWHAEPDRDAGAWHERDDDIGFLTGHLRWRDEVWEPPARWAEHLVTAAPARPLSDLHDRLRGLFAAGHLTRAGDGWVITDVLGLRCLYWGEDDEVVVLSSRAALAAQALARPGEAPPRDPVSACWLAFTGYRVGDRTGYRDVRVVPPGACLRLRSGAPTWEQTSPLVVDPDDDLRSRSVGELAELVHEDVSESLRAMLSHPADRHVVSLTGGKDSRLVLAVALRAGLAEAFSYETVGPPELADVKIASELCRDLGLPHEVRFLGLRPAEPFADRFRRFVESTACMVNGWELDASTGSRDLRLTGLCGELLRTYRKVPEARRVDGRIGDAFPRSMFGRLSLLRGGLGDELHQQLLTRLANEPDPSADPLDRLQAHFAGARMRFTRVGPREELAGDRRVLPLYSRTTVRAAMAMDSRDRQSEVLFAEVMRQSSELLVRRRFTDAGWDARAQALLGRLGPVQEAESTLVAGAPASGNTAVKATSLMASLYAQGSNERTELLAEVFADAGNPAWAVLDRAAALDALGRYTTIATPERHELFGAATVAVWLAG